MNPVRSVFAVLAVSVAAALSGPVQAVDLSSVPSGSYELDPTHAYLTFSYSHFGLSNPILAFDDFTVDLNLDTDDPTRSMVLVNIDANSVLAGSETYKQELVGENWLHTAQYPEITFSSTGIESTGEGEYRLSGDLRIRDVSQPLTLSVRLNRAMNHPLSGKPTVGLQATGTLLRSDFGLDELVPAVSDEVQLTITAELNKVQ